MEKCTLAKLLKDEIKHLNQLVEELEDSSLLSCPENYDCSTGINNIITHLQKIKSECKKLSCSKPREEILSRKF